MAKDVVEICENSVTTVARVHEERGTLKQRVGGRAGFIGLYWDSQGQGEYDGW